MFPLEVKMRTFALVSLLVLISAPAALAMDTSLDDGVFNDGSIRSSAAYTGTAAVTVYVDL